MNLLLTLREAGLFCFSELSLLESALHQDPLNVSCSLCVPLQNKVFLRRKELLFDFVRPEKCMITHTHTRSGVETHEYEDKNKLYRTAFARLSFP